jgi:flagellar assembly protein FliH
MSYRARRLGEHVGEPFTWEPVPPQIATPKVLDSEPANEVADAEPRLRTLERDAFAKGFAHGEQAGLEAARARTDGMMERLGKTIDEVASLRREIIRRTERQTVQLVLAIAERVVQREVRLDRSLLVGMARSALDRLGEFGTATIRLNPEDFDAVAPAARAADESAVRIVPDPEVGRGGCLVQSDFGFIDASPDAQFRELARSLLMIDQDGEVGS